MALDAGFVAGVLEGIEGTLDEVIERLGQFRTQGQPGCPSDDRDSASGFNRAADPRAGRQRRIRRAGYPRNGVSRPIR